MRHGWGALAFLVAVAFTDARAAIDLTCATCDRRVLDSQNVHIGSVRINQVGYRTDDPHKRAVVGDPKSTTFSVLRTNHSVAFTGALASQGTFPYKGRILTRGYFNSTTALYDFRNTNDTDSVTVTSKEPLWTADFGGLLEEGTFRVAVGPDTSLPFDIRMTIYNDVFETSLKYFGIERSGDNGSWMHGPSHMKDGSGRPGGNAKSGSLSGGWYDCGDYFKVGQTDAYAFTNLILAYTLWPQKAEDRYGNSYLDTIPFGNDGVPDLLREAKIGADFVVKLYKASVEDGLIANHDMYQEVGVWDNDHSLWDQPERQDAAPIAKGGAPRPVDAGAGAAVAAQFAGSLAFFAKAWVPFDPVYADSCLKIAKDIYAKVVIPNWNAPGFAPVKFYIVQGRWDDDLAWAATGLWYATGDTAYKFDLMGNTTYGNNPLSVFNFETFKAGFLAMHTSHLFSPGGWVMDYQNTFIHPIWALWDLFYKTDVLAAKWGIPQAEAIDMRKRILRLVGSRYAHETTNSPDGSVYPGTNVNILRPYDLVWSSNTWGMNRYNLGGLLPIVAYHEMIKGDSATSAANYWNIVLDNMNYNLGANPWDISFVMGAGSKNLQHPHNRISNPEGYNAGGIPYAYRSPKGALMGGAIPGQLLRDEWVKYDVTETCIDFSSQMVLPSQYLALDLPPDTTGPVFSNVTVVWVSDTSAIVSWQTDELSRDTLFYAGSVGGVPIGYQVASLAKSKSVTLTGLSPKTTYDFRFVGMDIYRNVSRDNNRGRDYQLTTTSTAPPLPKLTDVKACNIRSDRATLYWWTDVPSTSSVEYAVEGANFATSKIRVDGDDEGIPGRFHKVTLKGLAPGTTYRYDAISGPAREDSGALHYRFTTTADFANYTVQIKATDRYNAGAGAHFYLEVANNESKPYVGLELRFYFKADAATASKIVVHSNDNMLYLVTGLATVLPPQVTFGSAQPVAGVDSTWYIPITIADTLPVAGRLRIEMKFGDVNWIPLPFSSLKNSWSLVAHTTPAPFAGVDLNHLWAEAQPVELWNNVPTVTYVQDPYIAAYYHGEHIYGYTPDGDKPKLPRSVGFAFDGPLPSPATSVKQDSVLVHFSGRTWGKPDVTSMLVQRDSPAFVPTTGILSRADSVRFAQILTDPQGTTSHEWAFWADRSTPLCACAWQRYTVVVDTMKVPPRTLHFGWNPSGAVDAFASTRKPLTLSLFDSSGLPLDTSVGAALSASGSRLTFWSAATGGSMITTLALVHGTAQVWVSDNFADTVVVSGSASLAGSVVTSGSVTVRFAAAPPWPLVDSAWTLDANCDGIPDSVRISLSSAIPPGVQATGLGLVLDGKPSLYPPTSLQINGQILSIAAPAGMTGASFGTGRLALHVTTGGRNLDTASAFVVTDRVGPVVLSVSAQERFGAGLDTVRAAFSEPVTSHGGWPFGVRRSGAMVATPLGPILVRNALPDLLEWSLSQTSFAAGDSALWSNPGLVVDLAGNAAQSCKSPGSIGLRRKTVPLQSAAIVDVDGDGRADSVRLRFVRALGDIELPDSVKVSWGPRDSAIVLPAALIFRSPDSTVLSFRVGFPWGWTSASLAGANLLVLQGDAATGRRDARSTIDSVGPVLLAATLRRGALTDTLRITVSEPVRAGGSVDLSRQGRLDWTSLSRIGSTDSVSWKLVAPSGAFQDGDSVKLAPALSLGVFSDRSGNAAAPNAPWIRVQAGDGAPLVAVAQDLDGDGKAETIRLSWEKRPRRAHGFVFSAQDSSGQVVIRTVPSGVGTWTSAGDTLVIALVDPFPFGLTSGFNTSTQTELFDDGSLDSLPFALTDGVAPVAVSAMIRYASVGQTLDTLVVRSSEPTIFGSPDLFQVTTAQGLVNTVHGIGAGQSPDGRTTWLLLNPLDSAITSFGRGDSLRLFSPSARDGQGNLALANGHLVRVQFGTRPPRFTLDFLPGLKIQSNGTKPTGAPIEILVRRLGSNRWTTLDGLPVEENSPRIGPRIQTNSPLGGALAIFDNMGTYVGGQNLSGLESKAARGELDVDPVGQYEVWIAWNGLTSKGTLAASGVYAVRLILRRNVGSSSSYLGQDWMNQVYRIGWIVK